ncbi:MAG: type IX secretion system periplasmic lipoprotein PorW/SprE [Bacteroidales bacterium]
MILPFRNTIWGGTILLVLLILGSCSVEKNTSLSRNFHNLVSHYNIYFNGSESYKRGIEKAEEAIDNDYNRILDLFLFEDEAVHSAVRGDMQRAIDKATKVITYHSITAKPKVKEGNQTAKDKAFFEQNEYNKWVDDSYMLMGQAYMYQGEFFLAAETFKHVLVTFPDEDIHYLAMVWLARAYIMIGEMREAERIITSLEDVFNFPEEYQEALLTTRAFHQIKASSYAPAAGNLEEAMQMKGVSKENKIRYTYILAQLYEELEENDLALEKFRKVTRYNPPYEMAFNARVSMAEVYEGGSASSEELKKLLSKMLKDSKNIEYLDQIYFALGNIAMEEGERDKAIEYYQLSVATSLQNRYQKGFSSLTLAQIYYDEPDYILSAAYYDSAVSFLNRDFPGYQGLSTLSASLSGLVMNINTYELEDSVQALAALPEAERFAVIDGIIEKVRKEEEAQLQAQQQAQQDMAFNQSLRYNNQGGSSGSQQGGAWYFYNVNAKSFGQPEFRAKWGDRKLEDNWRRRNKQTISQPGSGAQLEGDSVNGGGGTQILDNKSREYYLVNIPLTDSAMEQSNLRLEEALFNMGVIYKQNLLDYQESVQAFEELLKRYPAGEYAPPSMYNLNDLYNTLQQPDRAAYYKSQLLSRYPDSHYSMLLNNPNYIKELEEEEQRVVRTYEQVYDAYKNESYASVIAQSDSAIREFEGDKLIPKFKYIKALSVGALQGKEEMKVELDSLIAQHPRTEESQQAQELIDYMYVAFPVIKEADEVKEAEEIYTTLDPGQKHYFLLALRSGEDVNQVSFNLLNYNLDNFNQYALEIEQINMNDGYHMLAVQVFNNADAALRYLQVIQENEGEIVPGIDPSNYRMAIISEDNFTLLKTNKAFNPYYLFFQNHYGNQE